MCYMLREKIEGSALMVEVLRISAFRMRSKFRVVGWLWVGGGLWVLGVGGGGGHKTFCTITVPASGRQVSWGDVLRMGVQKFVCVEARSYACTCVQRCMRVYTQNSSVAEEA